jgi:hypothetical protein
MTDKEITELWESQRREGVCSPPSVVRFAREVAAKVLTDAAREISRSDGDDWHSPADSCIASEKLYNIAASLRAGKEKT